MQRTDVASTRAAGQGRGWRAAVSAMCGTLVGVGLARFAYTPLIPALIEAGWFTPAEAAYLGAINFAGYLVGALLAGRVAAKVSAIGALRTGLAVATLGFFACAWPWPFAWFVLWRFATGVAGGLLMVLGAATVLPHVAPARRGLAGGLIFTGVGFGIAASGTLVPLLLRLGLEVTWSGLGLLSLALSLVAWRGWPAERAVAGPVAQVPRSRRAPLGARIKALLAAYALDATGLVPHMVFLVDFVARGLERGIDAGAQFWVVFGVGAIFGPLLAGVVADRIGFGLALRLTMVVQGAAVLMLAFPVGTPGLVLSSLVIGASAPGIVPLVLGRVHELIHDAAAREAAWRFATAAFGLGQAGGAFAFSWVFAQSGGYAALFVLGAACFALGLAIELAAGMLTRPAARRGRQGAD
jgi:predicted MFS family arabinose efflux permease